MHACSDRYRTPVAWWCANVVNKSMHWGMSARRAMKRAGVRGAVVNLSSVAGAHRGHIYIYNNRG